MGQPVNFTTPVGRLVAGSLYKGQTTDAEGKPLLVKNGPSTGQPRVDYYFALAIAKGPEQHWASTEWGAKIWALAHQLYPSASQNAKFSWKIADGDSQVPNGKGKKPCDREGWRGHWVLHFSSGFAPKIFKAQPGTNPPAFDPYIVPDAVKLGHYAQVNCNVDFNGSAQQPGVYLNHSMVCFSGYGPEIIVGPDASSAGFGAAPLPAGASMTPPANFNPAGTATPPGVPPVPGVPGAAPLIPNMPPPPGAMVPPMPLAAPPAAPARVMTAAANGHSYETLISQGWTDATLVANGLMVGTPAPMAPPALPPTPPAVPGVPVLPNAGFVQVPPAVPGVPGVPTPPGAAMVPPVPPAAPVRRMLPPANGHSYETLISQGWTDATLVANGLMAA